MAKTIITGTGSYIPEVVQQNRDFHEHSFYTNQSERIESTNAVISEKFQAITGIEERRYVTADLDSSDIGYFAAQKAIDDAGIDPELLDQIIFAHNFGDVKDGTIQTDAVPSLASRVKQKLGIRNPRCVAYDVLFGCPGWILGLTHSDAFLKTGLAKRTLVIGSETLSRVIDPYDRDSMIYSDGAGACVLEYQDSEIDSGILSSATMTHTVDETYLLFMGKSYAPEADSKVRYLKMNGRRVFEYALTHVPAAMKECLEKAGLHLRDVKKIFIHQANEKLDDGVVKRLYKLFEMEDEMPEFVMPMNLHKLGNSSVATVPTLFDLVRKGKMRNHNVKSGDIVMFASVGAGMNINAICYRI